MFERKVLRLALREVNKHAPFEVAVDLIADRRTRRRTGIRFRMVRMTTPLPSLAAPLAVQNAAKTVDGKKPQQAMFDFEGLLEPDARGSAVPEPHVLARRITVTALERLAGELGGAPMAALRDEWAAWTAVRDILVDRPARLLERWVKTVYGDVMTAGGGSEAWTAALGRDADGVETAVMWALGGLVAAQRQIWLNLARHKAPSKSALKIPDLNVEHFHAWVPLIAEDAARTLKLPRLLRLKSA